MGAAEIQRKLLEQLMGETSTTYAGNRGPQVTITDPKVCRSFLVGECPHNLFTNTKHDIGSCSKIHNEALRAEYQEASQKQKDEWGFEWDYFYDMKKHVDECNRKIDQCQRRLEKTPDEIRQTNELLKKIDDLTRTIDNGLLEVQILGESGMVNMAVTEFFRVRQAKQEREEKERELKALSDTSGPSGHQKLQVCDVCGAYLSRLDNDRRLADHFFGKMHLGFASMRKAYDRLSEELKGKVRPHREQEYSRSTFDERQGGYGRGGGFGRGGFRGGGRGRGGRYGGLDRYVPDYGHYKKRDYYDYSRDCYGYGGNYYGYDRDCYGYGGDYYGYSMSY